MCCSAFMPIGVTSSERPPLDPRRHAPSRADTMNFLPGASGSMVLSEVAFVG